MLGQGLHHLIDCGAAVARESKPEDVRVRVHRLKEGVPVGHLASLQFHRARLSKSGELLLVYVMDKEAVLEPR